MDLGLGNLDTLKAYCQQPAVQADTAFDQVLEAIGKGAASTMQEYCNRDFGRAVGTIDEFTANRSFWIARRYPVESISAL
jgi:hypothetical protein